jgi:hypothetical protein
MKDMTLSAVAVLVLALGIGLLFHWVYPRVVISTELAGLFVFMAVALKLAWSRLVALRQKPKPPADPGTGTTP